MFSVYVHIPFCAAKCGYCSFYSVPVRTGDVDLFLSALSWEAGRIKAIWGGRLPVRTLYIGGGTPTAMDALSWTRLLAVLHSAFDFSGLLEATSEANPCSLTGEHLDIWRASMLTRVSLGVQSLHDDELKWLGRLHNAAEAERAIEAVQNSGLALSADLIFGAGGQTLRCWHVSLKRLLSLGLEHISTYQLTLEPDTPLGKLNPELPDGYPFYRFAQWYLPRKGLEQYEIASFAVPGKECIHNLAYWRQENVLGLGPSAWGYLDGLRYHNAPAIEEYITLAGIRVPVVETERLCERGRALEAAILELRTKWGIDRRSFASRFGAVIENEILELLEEMPPNCIEDDGSRVRLTPRGMRIGNSIWAELLTLSD